VSLNLLDHYQFICLICLTNHIYATFNEDNSQVNLNAALEDVARAGEAAASLVHKFLTEDDDLFKEKNSSIAKLQLVCPAATRGLRNKQTVLQQQPALCSDLPLDDTQSQFLFTDNKPGKNKLGLVVNAWYWH